MHRPEYIQLTVPVIMLVKIVINIINILVIRLAHHKQFVYILIEKRIIMI